LNEVRSRLQSAFVGAEVSLEGDGNRLRIEIVAPEFEGLSRVKRQQAVYACISDLIKDGTLHAVTIQTEVPSDSSAAPSSAAPIERD